MFLAPPIMGGWIFFFLPPLLINKVLSSESVGEWGGGVMLLFVLVQIGEAFARFMLVG